MAPGGDTLVVVSSVCGGKEGRRWLRVDRDWDGDKTEGFGWLWDRKKGGKIIGWSAPKIRKLVRGRIL